MNSNPDYYSLITGASSGLGKAFAEDLARRKRNLLLVALPGTGLGELCEDLSLKYGIQCSYLEIDLLRENAFDNVYQNAIQAGLQVDTLINNVGVGYCGEVGTYSEAKIREIIMLNIQATTSLTNLFIGRFKSLPQAYILNVSSFGAYLPLPYKSIYLASKAYIYFFSRSLQYELRDTSVKVSVLMPGPMPTNNKVKERIKNNGVSSRLLLLTPGKVASYALDRLFSGKKVTVPGKWTQGVLRFGNIIPNGILLFLLRNLFKEQT
jgi:uncharacterized protein